MKIEKGKISDFQLMFLIITNIMGTFTFVSFADTLTKHDTWLVILSAFGLSIPFVLSYVFLSKRFPGKNLVQINDIVYGPFLGKLISILYSIFFLILLSLDLGGMADLYTGYVLPETPGLLFLTVCALVCAYAVRNGIESIVRISPAIFVITALVIILSIALQIGSMDFSNFLPFFEIPFKTYIQGVHTVSIIQYCGIITILMVIPNLNNDKQAARHALLGMSIVSFFMIAVSVRNTAVLGIASPIYFSDSYQAFRLIDIGNILTKMELFFAVALTLVLFIRISTLYYATVLSISQILHIQSYRTLILPIGSMAVCLSLVLFKSVIEHGFHAGHYHAIFATPVQYILPPVTLLIAILRGLPRPKGGESK